jgi:hypothetical protein
MFVPAILSTALQLYPAANDPPTSRVELVRDGDESVLYAYDADDEITGEITISPSGLQASFNGLFVEAELAADGTTISVECGGVACGDADLETAAAQIGAILAVLVQPQPEALTLRCALHIAASAGACAASGVVAGLGCLAGYYLAACECMGTVMVNGKDICDEIDLF